MHRLSSRGLRIGGRVLTVCFSAGLLISGTAFGQSITSGGIQGTVRSVAGESLPGAIVTIESPGGATIRELTSRLDGRFALPMMLPGTYSILIEVPDYQPVRLRGVVVAAGRTTRVSAELEERPPPINSVVELNQTGATASPSGRVVLERELRSMEYRTEATDLSRNVSEVVLPADGRSGFGLAAGGLPTRLSRVYVDGIPEILLRHPGLPGEPASLPSFPRDAVAQGQIAGSGLDTEWPGNPGSILSLITRSGTDRLEFAPYAVASSAKLGGNSALNPADSTGTSLWAGIRLGGPIKKDTASFSLQLNYQSVHTPSPFPWERNDPGSGSLPLREAIQQVAQDRYATSVAATVLPAVGVWKGGSGLGRLDWQLGRATRATARAGGATFSETNPLLGADVGNDAGARLSGRDLSGSVTVATVGELSNELRIGAAMARREWRPSALPETRLVAEAVRFGGNAALPGLFESRIISLVDAIQYQRGSHAIKGGMSLDFVGYNQEHDYGSSGRFLFGDLDRFNTGTGAYFRTTSSLETRVSAPEIGVFLQDTWRASPGLELLLGLRYETQILPKTRIAPNGVWNNLSGVGNDSLPIDRRGVQPRIGFMLDPGNTGQWTIQGGVGLYRSGLGLAQFAEAVHNSGTNVGVTRAVGVLGWPTPPSATQTAVRLTMFGGRAQFRDPRTLKSDLSLARALSGGFAFRVSGSYHHSDYLLRRTDLNLRPFPAGVAQDGRPVWGTLVKQGSLITSEPRSSRRFSEFDLVSVLNPTGFSDHYEATASISRQGGAVSFLAEYTYSHTRDNLVGLLEADPADQLSPFPGGIGGQSWDEGRSDLEVPHRFATTLDIKVGSRNPISLMIRGRFRSGLPFTPGFQRGVDVNGDLGGNNDPAPAEALATPGSFATCEGSSVAGFVARNSCREKAVGSLDLGVEFPIPVGASGGRRFLLTLEAYNLVASTTGVVDRALVLIDPAGALVTDPSTGAVQIPYVANPSFGTLLRRGGEPRAVRLGLRVEY